MEPNDDPKLSQLLREWQAPAVPASLDARVLGRRSWWRFLLGGEIRVPVPVGLAVLTALIAISVFLARDYRREAAEPSSPAFNLRDFQPVQKAQIRLIGDKDANR